MKLKKRIYLLTPLLVLVCVIAAGVFMKAPANVEAESYLIEKGKYESTKLIDVIDNENSDKYNPTLGKQFDLVEFDTVLFDYNGDEWNRFWSIINQQQDYYFSFMSYGEISKSINEGKYINENFKTGVNSGGTPVKQGILDDELVDGMPKFSAISFPYYNETWGKRMGNILFGQQTEFGYTTGNAGIKNGLAIYSDVAVTDGKAEIDAAAGLIREGIFPSKFQFVYNNNDGYYTYNSTVNHAQYNPNTQKVELYADTLGMTNGTKSQISLLADELATPNNNDYVLFDDTEGTWERFSDTNCRVRPGTATDYFTPSMRFTSFKEPKNKQMKEEIAQALITNNIEYIYVNFVINYNNISNAGSDNTIKFILTETDVALQNGKPIGVNQDKTYTQEGTTYHYFEYSYDYTDELYKDSNGKTKAEVELKIPVGDSDLTNLTSIGQIAIVPFNGNGELCDAFKDTILYFYLKDFGIGYNTNGRNNGQTDNNSISSFLPFQKIEDSYEGESFGKKNLESYLESWSTQIADSDSKVANRAVVNKYHENGLDAIEANSFGKTAPHFGMSMNIDFIIPEDGKTDFGDEIIFEFNGDDDLWVFVDDKLVLDMGGQHHAQNGKINFTTGQVIYNKAPIDGVTYSSPKDITFYNGSSDQEANSLSDKLGESYFETNNGKGYNYSAYNQQMITYNAENDTTPLSHIFTSGKHTVKVFYLERASGVSNCFIRFNLPQIPTADVIVSNEVKVSEDSDVKDITDDLNGDGILDENVSIFNDDGKLSYKYTDIEGNEQITSNGLVAFDYIAEYLVPEEYDIDGDVLPIYTGKYNLYKTDDPTNAFIENINIEIIKQENVTKEIDVTSDGNPETKDYTKYIVRFSVPVGYYAKIALPESSIVNYINQESPKYSDVGLSPLYRYDDTDFVVKATYYGNIGGGKLVDREDSSTHESEINNVVSGSSIGDYKPSVFLIGDNENEASVLRTDFTNYIAMDLYEIEIEKTFLEGKPVPVGQSILYAVECGLKHQDGETCDNPLCKNPLYVSMLIKDTKDSDGNVITPNPNTVIVKELPKGNYKITEKADWSWRYECYNVDVYRSETGSITNGTVISAEKK